MDKGARVEDLYRTEGVPETFVVDKNGDIVNSFMPNPRS